MAQLAGKAAIVTGGASGIGLAISERLAAAGIAVAILDERLRAARLRRHAPRFVTAGYWR